MWSEIINGAITQTVQDTDPITTADGTRYPGAWPKAEIPNLVAVVLATPPDPTQFTIASSTVALVNGVPTQSITTEPLPAATIAANDYATMLAAGLTITSTSTPSINGTYACTPEAQANFTSVETGILTNGGFLEGATQPWPVLNSPQPVVFTSIAMFKAVASQVGMFVDALESANLQASAGMAVTWPSASVTIP